MGAAAFFMFTLLILLEDLPNPDDPSQVKWWLGTAFAALPVGAVYGAITAMPLEKAASCELLVRTIPRRTNPQEDLQGEVLRAGPEGTANRIFPVDETGPKRTDDVVAYDALEGNGIQTVLEVSVERIALKADKNGSDPPLALIMEARSRLVRVRGGTVVDVNKFRHSSTPRKFAEWAADNAALLDKEYGDGVRKLARDIIRWNLPGKNGTE